MVAVICRTRTTQFQLLPLYWVPHRGNSQLKLILAFFGLCDQNFITQYSWKAALGNLFCNNDLFKNRILYKPIVQEVQWRQKKKAEVDLWKLASQAPYAAPPAAQANLLVCKSHRIWPDLVDFLTKSSLHVRAHLSVDRLFWFVQLGLPFSQRISGGSGKLQLC